MRRWLRVKLWEFTLEIPTTDHWLCGRGGIIRTTRMMNLIDFLLKIKVLA